MIIETIRLNPRLLFNLSEAQLISIPLFVVGAAGFYFFSKNKDKYPRFVPPPLKVETKK